MDTIKFEQFISKDVDVDVFNTLTDEGVVAFVGPIALTDAGKKEFESLLDLNVQVEVDGDIITDATVEIDTIKMATKLRKFLRSAAGYCSQETWNSWFYFPDEEDGVIKEG